MLQFCADLHIHSRFSRATSKQLTLRNLAAWAGIKGIDVLATGDFTHPGWMAEIEEQLIQEESGLLSLKEPEGLAKELPWFAGQSLPGRPKFILSTEISSIYKRDGKVRKIHNLVFMPCLEKAKDFNQRLGQIGNLESDGRPILGLDSRDLLEMVLETDESAFLIPAHIWTPWFSLFGSKSGFDKLEDCFRDLSHEIFALETGLSSDPAMNWLWSHLDRYYLVSNSDAHSGAKLAREGNLFRGTPSYLTIYNALKRHEDTSQFLGTLEFFPEEGKYHLDGHRKCEIVVDPREGHGLSTTCPVCGHPLTIGVLNRILSLADRKKPQQPAQAPDYTSLIPLTEIISEILGKGPQTKTVSRMYGHLIDQLGPELSILCSLPKEEIRAYSPYLAEAIVRMRNNEVIRQAGFDGQYGHISVFTEEEKKEIQFGQQLIPKAGSQAGPSLGDKTPHIRPTPKDTPKNKLNGSEGHTHYSPERSTWNTQQKQAIESKNTPLLVIAGPGTGKTKTLLGRAQQLRAQNVSAEEILIVTFTRDAAREIKERLLKLFDHHDKLPRADTLHALAYEHCLHNEKNEFLLLSEEEARLLFAQANPDLEKEAVHSIWQDISLSRERQDMLRASANSPYMERYCHLKQTHHLLDYTDLLEIWLKDLFNEPSSPYRHVLVDEVQDLSALQMSLLRRLVPQRGQGFFAIGDPYQSIYSFRGALADISQKLASFWEDVSTISLHTNYRSAQNLLDFSQPLFPEKPHLRAFQKKSGSLISYKCHTGGQEAQWIGTQVKRLIGGTSHLEADQEKTGQLGPGDIAVLVRFKALLPPIKRALQQQGIPFTVPEEAHFWNDVRITRILNTVSRHLGLRTETGAYLPECPADILLQGPSRLVEYYQKDSSFDGLFWESKAFKELQAQYASFGNWKDLLNWIRLEEDMSQIRKKAQKVRLLTIHAAKGLEFEAVFLPALEQGILPFFGTDLFASQKKQVAITTDQEEEKRLFFVGITRAKQFLFLSHASQRTIYGKQYQLSVSSLLSLLPWDMVQHIKSVSRTVKQEKQLRLL